MRLSPNTSHISTIARLLLVLASSTLMLYILLSFILPIYKEKRAVLETPCGPFEVDAVDETTLYIDFFVDSETNVTFKFRRLTLIPNTTPICAERIEVSGHVPHVLQLGDLTQYDSIGGGGSGPKYAAGYSSSYGINVCRSKPSAYQFPIRSYEFLPIETSRLENLPLEIVVPAYFYPFDQYEGNYIYSLLVSEESIEKFKINPNIVANFSGADEWQKIVTVSAGKDGKNNVVKLIFQRSQSDRVLTVILLSLIFVFILLLFVINDIGSILEISVGILFGLWSVQSILVPNYIDGRTLVHDLTFLLYILFALSICMRFIVKPLWYRLSPPDVALPDTVIEVQDIVPESTTRLMPQNGWLTLITPVATTLTALIALANYIKTRKQQ